MSASPVPATPLPVPAIAAQLSTNDEADIVGTLLDLGTTDLGQFCYVLENQDLANDVIAQIQVSSDGGNWVSVPHVPNSFVLTHASSLNVTNNLLAGGVTTLRYIKLSMRSAVTDSPAAVQLWGSFTR